MTEKLLHDSFLLAAGVLACGMVGCLVPILGQRKRIVGLLKGLPPSTKVVLLALAVGLTLVGATKTNRTGNVSGSLLSHSQTSLRVNALTQANVDQTDTARFLDIDVATNGTVSLVAHRPPSAATFAQDVVVVATTNLCTPSWFPLTNTAFAAGETNLTVALSRSFLLFNSIPNLGIFAFCDVGDTDGDGLADWHERYNLKTDSTLTDSDGDGLADGVEVTRGSNPRILAHEIIPVGFSFSRTNDVYGARVTNILARTIPVVRTNRWVQFFVSSRPDRAAGWTARDIALEHGVNGVFDYHVSALPFESDDSVRINFPEHSATSVVFTVQTTGNAQTGAVTVTAPAPRGRTVLATNTVAGVALAVFNASGREEGRWEASRTADGFRIRHLTVAGNATEDRSYDSAAADSVGTLRIPAFVRVGASAPDTVTAAHDELTGAMRIRATWRTTVQGNAFDTDVYEETRGPDGVVVESLLSEYGIVGSGAASVRRLTRRLGFDLDGDVSERRLYVEDDANQLRNGRLLAVTSNRRAWAWYDYDELGREICHIEQLDGSEFPENLSTVSTNAVPASAASITATSYAPLAGDSEHANDRDLPRRVETFVRPANAGGTVRELIATSVETWKYTRSPDARGVPLRTCVHTRGLGDLVATSMTTTYPDDAAVPADLRGRTVWSQDGDGQTTSVLLERGNWSPVTRVFTPLPAGVQRKNLSWLVIGV